MIIRRVLSVLCLSTALLAPLAVHATDQPAAVRGFGSVPLGFEENRGQSDPRVRFLARGPGFTLFLTPEETVLSLIQTDAPRERGAQIPKARTSAVRMRLLGAAPAEMAGLEPQPGHSNYLRLDDPQAAVTGVERYSRVAQRGAWPGIDVVYHGNQGRLEYDFVVAPGADPERIGLGYSGAERMSLDEAGNLHLHLAHGELVQPAPVLYQEAGGERRTVAGGFVLAGDQVRFQVGRYDREQPLVIDPQITWATRIGGSASDWGYAIAVTANGQAYIAGYTASTNFPTKPLSYQPSDPDLADIDAFVTKLNLDGTQMDYSTYLGGPSGQVAYGIALDSNRNAIVVGSAYEFDSNGDAFVVKLNAGGSALLYSDLFGGSAADNGRAVAVDGSGYAYVTGTTWSTNFPTTPGAAQQSPGGASDAFVLKIGLNGNLLYSTRWGGIDDEASYGIAVDASGRAYITGNVFLPQSNYTYDAFVARLNASGSAFQYSDVFGGSADDFGADIAVDGNNNAYVAGKTSSMNFPWKPGAYKTALSGESDAFVVKVNSTGSDFLYSTYVGDGGWQNVGGIAVDDLGTAYVVGWSGAANQNYPDAWAFRLNIYGSNVLSSLLFGGSGIDVCYDVALDSARNVYVAGSTSSPTAEFPAGNSKGSLGGVDAFVAKLAL